MISPDPGGRARAVSRTDPPLRARAVCGCLFDCAARGRRRRYRAGSGDQGLQGTEAFPRRGEVQHMAYGDHIKRSAQPLPANKGHQLDSLDDREEAQGDYTPSVLADWRYIPSEQLERKELRQALQEAMAQLSPEHREVLMMRDVRGMSITETAAATGANEGLVKVRLFRARLTMQKLLAPQLAPKQRGLMGWLTRKAGGR